MSTSPGPRRLDHAMDARRRELRLRWRDVADLAGISYETLRVIRNGQYGGMRPLTETGIERALQWQPGSVEGILSGGEPAPFEAPDPADDELRAELTERHRIDARLFGLVEADRRLEEDIKRINAERDRARDTSYRPESA